MKKLCLIGTIVPMLFASCVNHIHEEATELSTLTVNACLYRQEPMNTRSVLTDAVSRLSFWAIDDAGKAVIAMEQTSDMPDFGTVRMELPYGNYHIAVLGHSGTQQAQINEDGEIIFGEEKLTDSFLSFDEVNIEEGMKAIVNSTLRRRVAKFALLATDAIPQEVTTIEMEISGAGKSVNAFTGYASDVILQKRIINIPTSYAGKTNITFAFYTFLTKESAVIEVIATAKDSDGNILFSHSLKDIPMRVNQLTTAEGKLFRNASDSEVSVSIETDWLDEVRVEF